MHQGIDKLAYRIVAKKVEANTLPSFREVVHFEGKNGPDGIKRKSPSVDEPWHYVDPSKTTDTALYDLIADHHANLVAAIRAQDTQRTAFEMAWLAHAIVDGLTPAHHYPLGDTIEKLWGKPKEQRLTVLQKNLIIGSGKRDSLGKNWQYWGAKGVFVTHVLFELGIASSMTTHRFSSTKPDDMACKKVASDGFVAFYQDIVQTVYDLDMYQEFWRRGWTTKLARQTRQILIPHIIIAVSLAWSSAFDEARA